jgi:hypothetical protein
MYFKPLGISLMSVFEIIILIFGILGLYIAISSLLDMLNRDFMLTGIKAVLAIAAGTIIVGGFSLGVIGMFSMGISLAINDLIFT